jgi:hypothetical protein
MFGRSALLSFCGVVAALLVAVLAWLPAGGSGLLGRGGALQSRLGGLSMAEQAVISSRLGAAEPSYRARATSGGYLLAGGGLAGKLSGAGLSLRSGTASLSLSPLGLGRGNHVSDLSAPVVSAHGNQIELARGSVREAYAAGPLGIEQSFTLARRPVGATGPLTLALAMDGLRARWLTRGSVLSFGGVFRYGGLAWWTRAGFICARGSSCVAAVS